MKSKSLHSHSSLILIIFLMIGASQGESKGLQGFAPVDTVFVLITDAIPGIMTDVRYATKNNFTGEILYPDNGIYLRKIVADSLRSVQNELSTMGLSLKIYDGYRPLSVQKIMWEILPDTNYVADPAKGSRHNRGAAVDLTIVDSMSLELDMGTDYDDFTVKANPSYSEFPDNILNNRKLLANVMTKRGFIQFKTEWWHFDFNNWQSFSLNDFQPK
jgi:zinc D-Ala-D-Ala dipeptidase